MKNKKRQIFMLIAAGCLSAVGMAGTALNPVAAEELQQPEPFVPVPAHQEEINAIARSNLQVMIHSRDENGRWSTKIADITGDLIQSAVMMNKEHNLALLDFNTSAYPQGYVPYTGNYNGDPASRPSDGVFDLGYQDGKDHFGAQTSALLSKRIDGKWSFLEGNEFHDLWCAAPVPAEDLKQVSITFRSVKTGEMYRVGLIENTYAQTYLDERQLLWEQDRLNLEIRLDEYQKKLAELTGSNVEFGGIVPEMPAGKQYKDRRRVEVIRTLGGWDLKDQGYDVEGFPVEDHLGIDFLETSATGQPVSMFRLYNPNSGEHFYTASSKEKSYLVSAGWKDEGEGWKAPEISERPVYRLYNENAGDHHYTLNEKEKNVLVSYGWKYEGIGWYSDEAESIPLYRQYNPNAIAGSHNYTTSLNEHQFLTSNGWNDEGIAWFGIQ